MSRAGGSDATAGIDVCVRKRKVFHTVVINSGVQLGAIGEAFVEREVILVDGTAFGRHQEDAFATFFGVKPFLGHLIVQGRVYIDDVRVHGLPVVLACACLGALYAHWRIIHEVLDHVGDHLL